ncbi:iron chelate uptake ABC transporter family permease subunit [Nocardiopsis sp. RSe5-2]|uniref:Iron chelate uptake ABC transporter family permease subunit n=1 Tax=Nocardiopsis endophytica TaxID=3018445 RepID=A0ABT4UDN2_9ACTN|nr:iron chelate uptake ABC transporter family permease subunit [Nocardiopsis endophytica]MDA2815025.1 iron chelate uptake ABC transporter family permease subunit [Nocardiopsis endophytica]
MLGGRSAARAAAVGASAALLAATAVAALLVGEYPVPWRELVRALAAPGGEPGSVGFIVWELRVPRLAAGAAAGAVFAAAGAVLQVAWGSRAVDVRLLGMGGGAVLGAVLAGPVGQAGPGERAAAAVAGALAAGAVVTAVLRRLGSGWGPAGRAVVGASVDGVLTAAAVGAAVRAAGGWEAAWPGLAWVAVGTLSGALGQALVLGVLCVAAVAAVLVLSGAGGPGGGPWAAVVPAAVLCGLGTAVAGPLLLAGLPGAVVGGWIGRGRPVRSVAAAVPAGACTVLVADVVLRSAGEWAEPAVGLATGAVGVSVLVAVAAVERAARARRSEPREAVR